MALVQQPLNHERLLNQIFAGLQHYQYGHVQSDLHRQARFWPSIPVSLHKSNPMCSRLLKNTNLHSTAVCQHDPLPLHFNKKLYTGHTYSHTQTLMSTGKTCNNMDFIVSVPVVFIIHHRVFFPPRIRGEDIILSIGNERRNSAFTFSISVLHS